MDMDEFDDWCRDFECLWERVKRGLLFTAGGIALVIILALWSQP